MRLVEGIDDAIAGEVCFHVLSYLRSLSASENLKPLWNSLSFYYTFLKNFKKKWTR